MVSDKSEIIIHGSTSINNFSCSSSLVLMNDTLPVLITPGKFIFTNARLIFTVNSIECGDNYSNKQLRNTLKSNQFPFILVDLMEISPDPSFFYKARTQLRVEVAGKQQLQNVNLILRRAAEDVYHLSGVTQISMSEYDLVAPSPMMGLIKVEDRLDIEIHLVLKVLMWD